AWTRRSRTWRRGSTRAPACRRAVSIISAIRAPAPLRAASGSHSEELGPMTTSFVTKRLGAVGLARLVVVGFALTALGCTNLDEDPPSAITPAGFYRNEGEVLSSLAGIYAQLRSTLDDYYNLSEITTDEMIVPTRG